MPDPVHPDNEHSMEINSPLKKDIPVNEFMHPIYNSSVSNLSHESKESVYIPQLNGKRIIIAEDDPYSLEMLKIMLQDTKITMFVARDGEEVMDIFKKEPVDALLLDIRMPKKDGYELAREIRSSYPRIPIIAQSAFAMPEQIHKSLEMGFNKHLVKPLRREDLYHTLETYLK